MDIATGLKKVRQGVASISLATMLVSMLLTGVAQAAVANFNDVPAGAWYYTPVMTLANAAVIDGPSAVNNYNYNPNGSVNRAMMTKFAVLAAKFPLTNTSSFKDVDQAAWYAPYVNTAAAHGVVGGYKDVNGNLTGNFGPGDYVTREQAAKILVNAFSLAASTPVNASFPDVTPTMWSYSFVETARHWSVLKGNPDGTFKPFNNINRAELAQMVVGAMNPVALVDQPPVVSGALTVALASDTAKGTTVPSNATAVSLMKVNFVAGASDVKINGLTIHKSGVSALPAAFQGYLYNGNDRLTSGKSFSGTTDDMVFTNLNLSISKGNTLALTFKGDMGDVITTGNVQFQVKAVDSTAASVGGLPVTSSEFALSTTDVGSVTITKNGTVTNPKVGEDGVTIAKFKIAAATEAANIQQLGLYLAGTITTSDIENLKLYASDKAEPLATVTGVNTKDIAAFVLATPYLIEKGGTRNFTVVADLNTGRNADTLKAYIDEKTDVVAVGDKYGFGMQVSIVSTDTPAGSYDGTSCTSTAGDCTYSALEGGDITISSSGPTATDYSVNSKDVHLLNFNITSVSNVTFKNFDVGLKTSLAEGTTAAGLLNSTTANFTDIKIINTKTGAVLTSAVDSTSFVTTDGGSTAIAEANDANQAFYLFSDDFTMAAGESLDLAITADVANNSALNTETIVASLQLGTTYPEVRDINNKVLTNATSLVPSSDITGKTMTVKSAGLTLSLAATPVTDTFVKGTKDVKFAGFSFACGTASSCKVTDLTLTGYIDDDGTATSYDFANTVAGTGDVNGTLLNTYVGSVALKDAAGNILAASKGVQSNGTVAYSNMNWTIPAGDTVTAYVVGDLSSNAYANGDGELIAFAVASVANVTAEDKDGNSITSITGTPNTTVSQTAGTYVGTSAGGSLTVSVDSATPKENILVAGATDQVISKYKFTTTDESFIVKKLAINNRQESAVTADLGNYDNNVTLVKISYTNSLGVVETKTGTLTSGTAEFSGLDMFVAADDDAVLTVSANSNTIAAGAQAGEFVDLNLAFENFEAVAQGSGDTYDAGKLGTATDAASDLDFGAPTWTTSTYQLNSGNLTVTAPGTTVTATVDTGSIIFPVGTLFLADIGDNGVWTDGADSVFVLTSTMTATSMSLKVIDADDAVVADNVVLWYSLPGTGYLTAANQMHVYETKPTLTVDASSPSGSRSVAAADNAFVFDIAANSQEKVQVRTATELTTCTAGVVGGNTDTVTAADTTAGEYIATSSCRWNQHATGDANDTFAFDAGAQGVINQYARASFWIRSSVANTFAAIDTGYSITSAATAPVANTINALAASDCTFSGATTSATMVVGSWYYCDVAIDPQVASAQQWFQFRINSVTAPLDTNALLYVDRLVLYNDKIEMDMTGDDIDTQANGAHGLVAYLKDGGSTVATGYVAKTTLATAEGGSAKLTFFPIDGTDSAITVSKNTSTAFTVQLNTSTLLAEDAGADDPLTFSMDMGTSIGGTVTAGDFWWNDTNFSSSTAGDQPGTSYALATPGIIKWLGQVINTTLSGATVKY